MASCQKDQVIETTDLGTEFFISDNGYTSLDTEVTFTIENQKANLSTVKMTALGITDADGESVAPPVASWDIDISSGAGEITIPSDQLGLDAAGWSADFQYDATFDGKAIQRFHSLTVSNPMSLTGPYIWASNDDDPPKIVETPVDVLQNDSVQYIKWDIAPKRASIESLKIETKVGANSDYAEIAGGYEFDFDSLAIVGNDYNANDTVFYMFTATNGSHSQVGELSFVVNTDAFANVGGATLDTTSTQGFDLVANEIVVDTLADFEMVHAVLTSIGFQSTNGALFVAVDASVYDNNDIVETKAMFDAGTQVAGFENVEMGDVFVYKTMRGEDEHYGIIKITKAYLTTGGDGDYLEFEYLY